MKRVLNYTFALGLVLALAAAPVFAAEPAAKSAAPKFATAAPMNLDGFVSVLVTTPAGATKLNSVNAENGAMTAAGTVKGLAAPFNLGVMTKSTIDGAPLNVILLGEAAPVGSVQRGYGIGVLKYTKDGKAGKALIAIGKTSQFVGAVFSVETLKEKFPGALEVIQGWFGSACGAKDLAVESRLAAIELAGDSILAYIKPRIKESDRRPMDKDGNPTLLFYPKSKNIHIE